MERRIDVDAISLGLQGEQLVGREDRLDGSQRGGHALDDDELLGRRWVIDQHLEHETVDLCFRQGVGALRLDRVLRREDEERVGHPERLVADRDLALLHDLEQRALDLRRCAVDLVGQQQVREDRPERGVELAGLLVVDAGADEVGGDEVRCELDALELAADRLGERFDGHRLGKARHAFHEDVAPRQQGDDQPLQEVILADDHLLDLVEHALHRVRLLGRRMLVHGLLS